MCLYYLVTAAESESLSCD